MNDLIVKQEFVYEGNGPSYEKMTSQTNGG
jgi:hypothetical protein